MSGARWHALVVGAIALVLTGATAATLVLATARGKSPPTPAGPVKRPTLLLLTSLPLLFSEDFGLAQKRSPILDALRSRYDVRPIDVTDPVTLSRAHLLLMAQPRAQTAENLVALDDWVRHGGRLVLLADPVLEWPSDKPLGDVTRAPVMFADTGLLGHWGLRLDAPDRRGPILLGGGHNPVLFVSPGRLVSHNQDCGLLRADIIAECKIGEGRVTVIADADLINPDLANGREVRAANQTGEVIESLEEVAR